jgi:hypothetical protein
VAGVVQELQLVPMVAVAVAHGEVDDEDERGRDAEPNDVRA